MYNSIGIDSNCKSVKTFTKNILGSIYSILTNILKSQCISGIKITKISLRNGLINNSTFNSKDFKSLCQDEVIKKQ